MKNYFTHLATNLQTKQPVDLTMHIGDIEISQKTGKPYPKVRKDFRAEGLHKATFEKMYGKTDTLDIWFPSADLSKVASVFQEYRNDGGVPLAWVYSPLEAILDGEPQETYEIFVPSTQKRVFVDQPVFEKHIQERKLTGRDTLRLFFWLKKFMTAGIFCTCQLETRGVESSIPGILKMLAMFAGIGKLQVPFQLTYKIQESKGVDKDGANQKRMFPILSLHPDTTETGQQDMLTAAQRFLALAVAPEVMGTRAIQQTRPAAKALLSGQRDGEDDQTALLLQRAHGEVSQLSALLGGMEYSRHITPEQEKQIATIRVAIARFEDESEQMTPERLEKAITFFSSKRAELSQPQPEEETPVNATKDADVESPFHDVLVFITTHGNDGERAKMEDILAGDPAVIEEELDKLCALIEEREGA